MVAAESNPQSLKFALGGLSQDKDCLIKAKLWDSDYVERITVRTNSSSTILNAKRKKIVLSTRFSLAEKSSTRATRFTVELKKNLYIQGGNFLVYSPNAFNKSTCDPQWTDPTWPCRGTFSSCQKPISCKSRVPQGDEACWRYSFRYHLEEAFGCEGFMIQVVDLKKGTMKKKLPTNALLQQLISMRIIVWGVGKK